MKCCLLNWNLSGPIGEGGVLKWEPVHVSADEDCNPARFGNIQRNCQVVLTLSVPSAADTCSDKFTIFSHLHNIHTSSQYSHIFTTFTHLHNIHTSSQYSHIFTIFTHLYNIHTSLQYSHIFTIFTHLHNIHTSSQYSHIFTIFTHLHIMQRINSVHFAQLHEFEFKMHEIMTKSVRVHCRILFPAFSPSINR